MKESDALKLAQMAVVDCQHYKAVEKLEIIAVLMDRERVALFVEQEREKNNEAVL